ncbi:PREDICTED: gasdermin-A3-like [Crocodylus porosus]|uniref:gasdermin-A3-like n=1 Tax=Crocodylus porosus TaxID=8502 RepID=UPI00093A1014|nr:PREDICTED: gasdermin-A3-like [Crocodylus porosus]XP_019405865.1 PREDICTED: gasdermin-A3-like [Crocodylus porosus]
MFKTLAKQIIQELDSDGRFTAVSSLASANNYKPFCVVRKEQFRLPWQPRKYLTTPYKLQDVAEKETNVEAEVKYDDPFVYDETTKHKAEANLSFDSETTEVDISGSGYSSYSVSQTSVRKAYVVKRVPWKIDMTHQFIQQFSDSQRTELYVVTEAIELMAPLVIKKTIQGRGNVQISAVEMFRIQGRGRSITKKAVMIPKGTVMAYVVEPLNTQKRDFCCHKDKNPKARSLFLHDGVKNELVSSLTEFQTVKDTVKEEYEQLTYLSQSLKLNLLENFLSFLQDGDIVSTVQTLLEISLAGGEPMHSVLDSLDENLQPRVEKLLQDLGVFHDGERGEAHLLWQPLHFLCSSLEDLDSRMLPLLAACLEQKMVVKQLELMDGVLEWILSSDKGSMFALAFFLAEEELNITIEMLHICGVMPDTSRSSLTCIWNKAAQSNLTALYASLYGFWILSE